MPKRSKKRGKGKVSQFDLGFGDVTLGDSANCAVPIRNVRGKKMATKMFQNEVDDVTMTNEGEVEDWFDKNLSDFDDEPTDIEEEEHVSQRKKGSQRSSVEENESIVERRSYPIDLWFILANFIDPEDVGRFCLLCKDALRVINSSSFWRKLYKRHYDPKVNLPTNLQPGSMEGTYGIRANVITALHRFYPLFQSWNKQNSVHYDERQSLSTIGSICLYTWSQGRTGCHCYQYFKFKQFCDIKEQNLRNRLMVTPNIWANSYEGESIISVLCPYFQPVPLEDIMGLHLANISVSVSRDMCYNRLKLEFSRSLTRRKNAPKSDVVTVVLDPIIAVNVINWWHPLFKESLPQIPSGQVHQNGQNHWDGF